MTACEIKEKGSREKSRINCCYFMKVKHEPEIFVFTELTRLEFKEKKISFHEFSDYY